MQSAPRAGILYSDNAATGWLVRAKQAWSEATFRWMVARRQGRRFLHGHGCGLDRPRHHRGNGSVLTCRRGGESKRGAWSTARPSFMSQCGLSKAHRLSAWKRALSLERRLRDGRAGVWAQRGFQRRTRTPTSHRGTAPGTGSSMGPGRHMHKFTACVCLERALSGRVVGRKWDPSVGCAAQLARRRADGRAGGTRRWAS